MWRPNNCRTSDEEERQVAEERHPLLTERRPEVAAKAGAATPRLDEEPGTPRARGGPTPPEGPHPPEAV